MNKIQPNDISTKQHFFNAFDNREREVSARWIVEFCQKRGTGWEPFTKDDIEQYYNGYGHKDFWFNGLVCSEYGIAQNGDVFSIERGAGWRRLLVRVAGRAIIRGGHDAQAARGEGMSDELECQECNWQGDESLLLCSDADDKSNKAVSEIAFNLCPDCGSDDLCNTDAGD